MKPIGKDAGVHYFCSLERSTTYNTSKIKIIRYEKITASGRLVRYSLLPFLDSIGKGSHVHEQGVGFHPDTFHRNDALGTRPPKRREG